jgi:glycosyltransferase involved in cell wall biosynthesis
MMSRPLVSIVIPARNEEENIPRLETELALVSKRLSDYDLEFVVVDNASSDRTGALVKDLCGRDSRWRYVRLSRNFTVEMSLTAGYRYARGDAIVVLYSDLQDPPDVIPEFLTRWREGFDVVYGVRTERPGDPGWRNAAVKLAYRTIRAAADIPIPLDAGDFRLISRRVRDALLECPENNRYLRGLITWLGFSQIGVPYTRRPRRAGRSNAPFGQLVPFTLNAITSFSMRPLRLFLFGGIGILALCLAAAIVYVALYFRGSPPPGITTLLVLLLGAIGLNSVGIGVLGEYLGRTYAEVKRRPLYVVEETLNVERPPITPGRLSE